MPLTPAQSAFFLYGWHSYAWSSSPRLATAGLTATPTAAKQAASIVVQLPAASLAAIAVTAESGERSGAPDMKSASVPVAAGGSTTLPLLGLQTGKTYYVRAVATYSDGTEGLTPVETTVVPT